MNETVHRQFDLDRSDAQTAPLIDPFARAITYLRVSVTDRCDFRCVYCMSEHMSFLPKADLLSLEELDRVCSAFVARGVRKLRLTGGEPLVRRGIMTLFASLSRHLRSGALDELTLTTNGSQLVKYAAELKDHGVQRINVSLDTLDADKFRAITRWGDLGQVMAGIDAAQKAGLAVKINAVALKGVNEDEFPSLIDWAHGRGMDLTLIEVMPLGEVGEGRLDQYLPLSMVRARLAERYATDRYRSRHRRPRALCASRRDRRPPRLHHADDAQFLRILQPGAADLHRHSLYVPRPGRRRRPARAVARVRKQRAPAFGDRRRHRPQAQGARFRHRPPACPPRLATSHERHRRLIRSRCFRNSSCLLPQPTGAASLALIAATAAFSVNDAIIKLASRALPVGEVIFIRGLMTVVCMAGALAAMRQLGKIPTAFTRWVAARAFLDGCATALFVTGLMRIKLADLTAMVLASPLILTALSVLLFKEVVGWRRWSAIVVGFIGALFIVRPVPGSFDAWALMGLGAACAVRGARSDHAPARSENSRAGDRARRLRRHDDRPAHCSA